MQSRPFFSVIIPTRNRSFIVGKAIESVLNQTFTDFEVLIIDNDVSDATEKATKAYTNPKVRYFQTGNLAMHDNWEYGINQSQGEYLTILEDKAVLHEKALEVIFSNIVQYANPDCVVWDYAITNSESTVFSYENGSVPTKFSTDEVLQIFLSQDLVYAAKIMPRFANSCCKRSIIEKCHNTPVGRVFPPCSPDYTSAYMQLALFDNVLYVNKPLVLFNMNYSNGDCFARKKTDSLVVKDFIKLSASGTPELLCKFVPIKSILPYNTVMNDYIMTREQLRGKLENFPINLINYYKECYREITTAESLEANIAEDKQAFQAALNKESTFIQNSVKNLIDKEFLSNLQFFIKGILDSNFQRLFEEGKSVVMWGVNSIAYSLLNLSPKLAECVKKIVDSNLHKQHQKFGPRGIEIVPPEHLIKNPPDIILICSVAFASEIERDIKTKYKLDSLIISPGERS